MTYSFNPTDRLTAGLSIDGDHFYVNPRNAFLPKTCLYSKSLMRLELKYEASLGKDFNLCVRHGGCHTMSGRLYKENSHTQVLDFDTRVGPSGACR